MIDSTATFAPLAKHELEQIRWIPEGAISVTTDGQSLCLRASEQFQEQFEELLERRKQDGLSKDEERLYLAMCQLDVSLSWLNRLARNAQEA